MSTDKDTRELVEAPETRPVPDVVQVERERWWQWNGCQLNWHDVFIGVYWKAEQAPGVRTLSLYICPLPCLVLRFVRVIEYNIIPQFNPRLDEEVSEDGNS
jgi:hypothetical protein